MTFLLKQHFWVIRSRTANFRLSVSSLFRARLKYPINYYYEIWCTHSYKCVVLFCVQTWSYSIIKSEILTTQHTHPGKRGGMRSHAEVVTKTASHTRGHRDVPGGNIAVMRHSNRRRRSESPRRNVQSLTSKRSGCRTPKMTKTWPTETK